MPHGGKELPLKFGVECKASRAMIVGLSITNPSAWALLGVGSAAFILACQLSAFRGICSAAEMCPSSRQKFARPSRCHHLCVWVSPEVWGEDDCSLWHGLPLRPSLGLLVIPPSGIGFSVWLTLTFYSPNLICWGIHLSSIAQLQRAISRSEEKRDTAVTEAEPHAGPSPLCHG